MFGWRGRGRGVEGERERVFFAPTKMDPSENEKIASFHLLLSNNYIFIFKNIRDVEPSIFANGSSKSLFITFDFCKTIEAINLLLS